jgi:oxygen-independent coproporphyrinogen-3 oxidase
MAEKIPERWLEKVEHQGNGLVIEETLTLEESADEMLLMGLRLREGIATERYLEMSGRDFSPARIAFLNEHGLIEVFDDGRLRTTHDGWLVLDSVVADLAA